MWCYFYIIFYSLHCPLSGPDLTYISLLIIPCIIYYVTNKETLNLEGRLLSRSVPSATQTVSTVCVRSSGMAVLGPPLRALPVSPCVYEGCRGRPYPVTGSGRQDPQLPRRLAYPSPIQRAVGRPQGLGAPAPQPVGASGQLGKEQALPCAENLFSRCGVRLGEYDGMPHGGMCPSSAELPEFLQRQECGTTETVSEAPGAYGIRSCSHAARIASYETTSALATLPGPEVGHGAAVHCE